VWEQLDQKDLQVVPDLQDLKELKDLQEQPVGLDLAGPRDPLEQRDLKVLKEQSEVRVRKDLKVLKVTLVHLDVQERWVSQVR